MTSSPTFFACLHRFLRGIFVCRCCLYLQFNVAVLFFHAKKFVGDLQRKNDRPRLSSTSVVINRPRLHAQVFKSKQSPRVEDTRMSDSGDMLVWFQLILTYEHVFPALPKAPSVWYQYTDKNEHKVLVKLGALEPPVPVIFPPRQMAFL